jgi:hypothetical protein
MSDRASWREVAPKRRLQSLASLQSDHAFGSGLRCPRCGRFEALVAANRSYSPEKKLAISSRLRVHGIFGKLARSILP